MNELKLFSNPRFGNVRVVEINGKTHFVGSDVAKSLGYKNPSEAINDHCRGVAKCYIGVETGMKKDGTPAIQQVEMNVIPQGDIYRLAAKSELPGAEEFESWIFDDVLVSIANNGGYIATSQEDTPELIMARALIVANSAIENHKQKLQQAEKQIATLKPKAELMEKIIDSGEKIDIGQTAKILGLPFGRNTLFKKLRELGIFFKNRNEPKQEYIDRKYFELKEQWIDRNNHDGFMIVKVLVTQKGLEFINKMIDGNKSDGRQMKIA